MKRKKNEREYPCSECANASTVICDSCRAIETPSGEKKWPSHFVEMAAFNYDRVRIDALTRMMERQLKIGGSIPLAYVIEYNERVEKRERELLDELEKMKLQDKEDLEEKNT